MAKKIILPHYEPIDKKYLCKDGSIDFYTICEDLLDDDHFIDDIYHETDFDEMDGRLYSMDYPKYYYWNGEILNYAEDCIGRPIDLDEQAELITTGQEVYENANLDDILEDRYWRDHDND